MISAQRVQVGVALLLGGRPPECYRCAAGTPRTARPPSRILYDTPRLVLTQPSISDTRNE